MTNDVRWKGCCHGASTETELRVPTGLREPLLRPIAASSAKRVRRISYFIDLNGPALKSVPARSKLPTYPRPRLYICYESLERVIGINHKYWNHGKIKETKAPLPLSTSEMALSLPEGL